MFYLCLHEIKLIYSDNFSIYLLVVIKYLKQIFFLRLAKAKLLGIIGLVVVVSAFSFTVKNGETETKKLLHS